MTVSTFQCFDRMLRPVPFLGHHCRYDLDKMVRGDLKHCARKFVANSECFKQCLLSCSRHRQVNSTCVGALGLFLRHESHGRTEFCGYEKVEGKLGSRVFWLTCQRGLRPLFVGLWRLLVSFRGISSIAVLVEICQSCLVWEVCVVQEAFLVTRHMR